MIDLAIRCFRESLGDPDPFVRAVAIYGLAQAGNREQDLFSLESYRNDRNELVREAAEYAIKKIASTDGR